MNQLVIDNIAIPTDSMIIASKYFPNYLKYGGTKKYQEYIQLVEKNIVKNNPSTNNLLEDFFDDYFPHISQMILYSNRLFGTSCDRL